MNRITRIAAFTLAAAIVGGGIARAASTPATIVDVAVSNGSFKTLVAALDAAGLVATLKGDGPFTVFAPTDEAFAKLPAGTVESLLEPANRQKLVAVLTYHVVSGKVSSAQAGKLDAATSLQGAKLPIARAGQGLTVGGANVVIADVAASNGVVHVIDTVLLPPAN
jgi:uncharacterized surface protein with fasciclin (FAS1) repeats